MKYATESFTKFREKHQLHFETLQYKVLMWFFARGHQVRIQDLVGGGASKFVLDLPTARSVGERAKRANMGRGPGPTLGPWKLLYF